MKQAPESIDEYVDICQMKYRVSFKIFNKINVNGKNADPLYNYLTQGTKIRWNFTKFLIDREGNIVKRYDSKDTPLSFEQDIVALL
jgi:glutathione peroxidase